MFSVTSLETPLYSTDHLFIQDILPSQINAFTVDFMLPHFLFSEYVILMSVEIAGQVIQFAMIKKTYFHLFNNLQCVTTA